MIIVVMMSGSGQDTRLGSVREGIRVRVREKKRVRLSAREDKNKCSVRVRVRGSEEEA